MLVRLLRRERQLGAIPIGIVESDFGEGPRRYAGPFSFSNQEGGRREGAARWKLSEPLLIKGGEIMKNGRNSRGWAILLFLPFLIMFILFWVVPIAYGLYMSFHNFTVFGGSRGFVGLDNYAAILTPGSVFSRRFYLGLGNTLTFVALSVPPLILIGLGLALVVNALKGKLKTIFRTTFFISYSISVTAVSAIFLWMFNGNGGFINNILNRLGVSGPNWLSSQPEAWITILATTVWWTIGYNMILFLNALDEVDDSLYEASSLDGANAWQKFWYVTFPSIIDVFFFIMMTTIIASFNLYGQSLLITDGGPSNSTTSLIMIIQQTVFAQNNLGIGSAMAIVLGLIMMTVTGIQYYFTRRRERAQ